MTFDYKKTGMPEKKEWIAASHLCFAWLNQHMSMFGPERILNFMGNQPIAAAKLIMENCDDWSDESVTLALAGPAKSALPAIQNIVSTRTFDLLKAYVTGEKPSDPTIERDCVRLFLVEGLSTMNDQLIGRKRIDKHHQVRWNILGNLEKNFAGVKGQNPKLDLIFETALKESRLALEALDAAAKKKPNPPAL